MNFTFDPVTYESYKPQIFYVQTFFRKHDIKKPSLDFCFQTCMSLISGKIETIRELSNYLYYSLNK